MATSVSAHSNQPKGDCTSTVNSNTSIDFLPIQISQNSSVTHQVDLSSPMQDQKTTKKQGNIIKGLLQHGLNLKFPPHSLNSLPIKNNSIPQGFALRVAVSVAPSLNKELATPGESLRFQSLPDTQTIGSYTELALILNLTPKFLKQKLTLCGLTSLGPAILPSLTQH